MGPPGFKPGTKWSRGPRRIADDADAGAFRAVPVAVGITTRRFRGRGRLPRPEWPRASSASSAIDATRRSSERKGVAGAVAGRLRGVFCRGAAECSRAAAARLTSSRPYPAHPFVLERQTHDQVLPWRAPYCSHRAAPGTPQLGHSRWPRKHNRGNVTGFPRANVSAGIAVRERSQLPWESSRGGAK